MKLATRKNGTRDGQLIVVSRDHSLGMSAEGIARTLQEALENWEDASPRLLGLSDKLNGGDTGGTFPIDIADLESPLPRAYQFIDGSAYLNHIRLVRKARGAEMPTSFETDPLVYQGVSDHFLPPTADIVHAHTEWGIDFEAEIGILTGDVPYRTATADAEEHIKLLVLINDISLRALIPPELAKGFGFLVSKPPSALSPFAITPDELGQSWRDGKVWLPLEVHWNGEWFGAPEAGPEMQFSFPRLIEHVTQTRPLRAGTLIGSGTISNADRSMGSCCVAEKRMIEKIDTGEFKTPFMAFGDTVKIEMKRDGESLFGAIEQRVVKA